MNKELAANTNLSHYRIARKLGSGGMGEVYLAEDKRLDRSIALKILPADLAADPERMRRFVLEAKATSALNHPNIITIYEIDAEGETRFIAAEYIEGETLRERLKANRFSVDDCLEVAVQITSALQAAHHVNIVHRDIKPENIMIRPDGLVKILDFGIAKLTEKRAAIDAEAATRQQAQTALGMIIGTAAYMSPEQAQGKAVDARSDIFSFGVVLYEMLSGKQPFEGENAIDVIGRILHKEPISLNQLLPEIPAELERIINKALCKDCPERYQTAKDLLVDLKELKQELDFQSKLKRAAQTSKETAAQTQIIKAGTGENSRTTSETTYANSIAVLPFSNMSADAENEYFCDGLAEELLNALAKIDDLKVAARTSAFSFKGKNVNTGEIANALNVKTILEGSVRKSGNRLRITVQLVNASDGYHLWSERYDREMKGIFDLQDEITLAVVDALKVKLFGDEKEAVLKRGTNNTEAYEFYLKGRFHWNKRTGDNLKKAIELFQQAVEKDPNYALAYVGLADSYLIIGSYAGTPASEVLPQARAAATRALEIDDQLAEARASMAHVYWRSLEWERAEAEFKHAISLNPNYATAHQFYSEYLRALRRFDEQLREIKLAQEIEPLSHIIGTFVGAAFHNLGETDAAINEWKRVIELEPNFSLTHFFLANAYVTQKRYEEAINEAQKAVNLSGRGNLPLGGLGYAYAMSGRRSEALAVIKELEEKHARREATGFDLAHVYSGLKDNDKAVNWLEKDFETGNTSLLIYIAYNPLYPQLGEDPRYQDLLRRMGFPADVIPRHKATPEAKTEIFNTETRNSIAVLPFADMSADANNEYFCDGLAEEILNALAKIEDLKVAARTSAFSFKNKNVEVSRIGKTLNVKTVLEGSVRKSGSKLRITVQLINAADGYHLWSERYDREMRDIFDVQDEITLAVVDALKVKLLGEEKADLLKRYTDNTEAYELYLKGLYHNNKYTPEGWTRAIEYFDEAIRREPEYAAAFAAKAHCQHYLYYYAVVPPDEIVPQWRATTNRALELDERVADAHLSLAKFYFYRERDWERAEREFKRAIELNPNSALAHQFYGMFLASRRRMDEAIREGEIALELDPLSLVVNLHIGWVYWSANRFDDTFRQATRMIEIEPNFFGAYLHLGTAQLAKGNYEEAVEAFRKSSVLGGTTYVLSFLGWAYALAGKREEAFVVIDQLLDAKKQQFTPAFNIARVYSGLGLTDKTYEWL
ncbi:MAG TPA: protein kinase, partial [Pyrinomonadaceae bacterium]